VIPSENSNGSPITNYEIWRDIGSNLGDIDTQETDYDGTSAQFTITGLDPGIFYKFAILAVNVEGKSDLSTYLTIVSSELPDKPAGIYKNSALSSQTSILLYWDKVLDK
jgi:hypothetical protein